MTESAAILQFCNLIRMRLACVVHRFGADIAGGSEAHCRIIAERLAERHDVTVYTTTAKDHITWKNEYPPGVSRHGRLEVRRFPVARLRSLHRFAELSERVFSGAGSEDDEIQWFRENGPETPQLVDDLAANAHRYDRVLFWSFRYYQTFFGLPLAGDRAVLVPTAEDDPVMRFDVLGEVLLAAFRLRVPDPGRGGPRRAPRRRPAGAVLHHRIRPRACAAATGDALRMVSMSAPPFVLYLGRIDPNKGCRTLLSHYQRYQSETGSNVPLVMAGPANMPVPEHPLIRRLGFVSDEARAWLLSNATALVVPSPYESLSLVLLEAWNYGVPALVNGRCDVLRGQVLRADGGLYYRSYDEWAAGLAYLLGHPDSARQLGRQGRAYVDREYRWPQVVGTLEAFLGSLASGPPPGEVRAPLEAMTHEQNVCRTSESSGAESM